MKMTEVENFIQEHAKKLYIICAVIFFGLCLMHFFSQRPLWYDESAVLENLTKFSGSQLFSVLDKTQVFPRVHLVCLQEFAAGFGNHLLALRFFSLISMLSAFFIWMRLYENQFESAVLTLGAIWFFICSYQMTYYAAELKPYATDVFAVGLTASYLFKQRQLLKGQPKTLDYIACVFLPGLIFFSYGALFVFWLVGFNLLLLAIKNKSCWRLLLMHVLASGACFYFLNKIDLSYSVAHEGLHHYWKNYFISFASASSFFSPLTEGLRELGSVWFGNKRIFWQAATPFVVMFVYALGRYGISALQRDRFQIFSLDALALILVLELFLLSLMHKYPFTGDRVTLFFAPFVFYLIVKALRGLSRIPFAGDIFILYYGGYTCVCLGYSAWQYLLLYFI